jgi:hypothetical protein
MSQNEMARTCARAYRRALHRWEGKAPWGSTGPSSSPRQRESAPEAQGPPRGRCRRASYGTRAGEGALCGGLSTYRAPRRDAGRSEGTPRGTAAALVASHAVAWLQICAQGDAWGGPCRNGGPLRARVARPPRGAGAQTAFRGCVQNPGSLWPWCAGAQSCNGALGYAHPLASRSHVSACVHDSQPPSSRAVALRLRWRHAPLGGLGTDPEVARRQDDLPEERE